MRILVVGAGAVGGYFGGRLVEAGREVTFLVRPQRRAKLASAGLRIRSSEGDVTVPAPSTILAEELARPGAPRFDVVILSSKAYDLEEAIGSFAPAVGPDTAVLPLLNGMRHLAVLDGRFGRERVLGGLCMISTVLEDDGTVRDLGGNHRIVFGERDGSRSTRVLALEAAFSGARFDSSRSDIVVQEMWEKWVFIATGAALTSLMRAAVGDIVAAGGGDVATMLLDECAAIAASQGYAPRPAARERAQTTFTAPGSSVTASMLRDIERHSRVEADQIVGDLLARAGTVDPRSLLRIAYVQLKAYEARREREAAADQA